MLSLGVKEYLRDLLYPLGGQQVSLLKSSSWRLMLRVQCPMTRRLTFAMMRSMFLINSSACRESDSYRYQLRVRTSDGGARTSENAPAGRGPQTLARDSVEFPSSQKNSVRFAAEEFNPTTDYYLDHSALRFFCAPISTSIWLQFHSQAQIIPSSR